MAAAVVRLKLSQGSAGPPLAVLEISSKNRGKERETPGQNGGQEGNETTDVVSDDAQLSICDFLLRRAERAAPRGEKTAFSPENTSPSQSHLHEVLQRLRQRALTAVRERYSSSSSEARVSAQLFFVNSGSPGADSDSEDGFRPLQSTGDLLDVFRAAEPKPRQQQGEAGDPPVLRFSVRLFVRDEVSAVLSLFDDAQDRVSSASDLKIARSEAGRWKAEAKELRSDLDTLLASNSTAMSASSGVVLDPRASMFQPAADTAPASKSTACPDCQAHQKSAVTNRLAAEKVRVRQ
jgi:hypothetical protein